MTLELDRRCEDIVFEELEAGARRRGRLADRDQRGARRGAARRGRRGASSAGRDRSDRRLDERAADDSLPLALDRRRRRRDDGRRRLRLRPRLRRARGVRRDPRRAERPSTATRSARRGRTTGLEVVGLESAEPGWILGAVEALEGKAYRLRAVGSIAITLAYVAAGASTRCSRRGRCRSVDAAASQLIVREAGGRSSSSGFDARRRRRSTSTPATRSPRRDRRRAPRARSATPRTRRSPGPGERARRLGARAPGRGGGRRATGPRRCRPRGPPRPPASRAEDAVLGYTGLDPERADPRAPSGSAGGEWAAINLDVDARAARAGRGPDRRLAPGGGAQRRSLRSPDGCWRSRSERSSASPPSGCSASTSSRCWRPDAAAAAALRRRQHRRRRGAARRRSGRGARVGRRSTRSRTPSTSPRRLGCAATSAVLAGELLDGADAPRLGGASCSSAARRLLTADPRRDARRGCGGATP